MAELVSAYPTAGGMYFVTKHVVPADQVPIFSWVQGWCNLLGQTAGVSSVAYTVSQMLLAAVSMNSDLVDGQYSYSPYGAQPNDLLSLTNIFLARPCKQYWFLSEFYVSWGLYAR